MARLPLRYQGRKLLADGLDEVRWERGHGYPPSSGSLENSPDDRASRVRFPLRVVITTYPRKLLVAKFVIDLGEAWGRNLPALSTPLLHHAAGRCARTSYLLVAPW